jgi:DNA-3-methyladenine glycosylase
VPRTLQQPFFARSALEVARDLVGCTFLLAGVGGRIVETEAYRQDDPCCHAYNGRTERNAVLFGPPGCLYVYFTYGMHFCGNVACEEEGVGAGVLLRALEPEQGVEQMIARRGVSEPRLLASGPARLAQALGIGREQNGLPVWRPPLAILSSPGGSSSPSSPSSTSSSPSAVPSPAPRVVTTARIGVRGGDQRPWRFVDADSRFLSRPLSRTPMLPSG